MTSVVESVPPDVARILKWAAYLFTLFFFGALFYYGLFQTLYNSRQTSPAIGLVMSIPYASLPAGFFIMFFLTLEEFWAFARPEGKGEGR
jgi:TRAP-type C4-dicarboxylate transport system permease small subunit